MGTIQGERIPGDFVLHQRHRRHSLRGAPQRLAVIHDADECRDETLVQLYGGAVVRVPCSLDEVLAWFA